MRPEYPYQSKKLAIYTGMLFFGIVSHALADNQINFAAAINYALASSPQITASNAKIEAAEAAKTAMQRSGLVKVNLESSYGRSNNPLTVFASKLTQGSASFADFGANQYTGPAALNVMPDALNNPGYYSNFNTGLAVNIPLFQGGANVAAVKQAHALLTAAKHGSKQAKTELIYAILQSYEGVHSTQELIDVARSAQKAAAKYLEMSKNLLKQSIVIESDVLMAETNLRNALATVNATIAEKNNQLDAFRILIGKPQSDLTPGASAALTIPKTSTEGLINRALTSNSKILSLRSQANAAHSAIDSAKASNLPAVDLQLRHDWNADTVRLAKGSNAVLVKMSWQLFSSGEQTASVQQAAAMGKEATSNIDNLRNNINISVIKLVRAIETADFKIKAGELNIKQMQQVVNDLTKRYGQGVIPLGQILDAEARLDTMKSQQIMTRYNKKMAQGQLLSLIDDLK